MKKRLIIIIAILAVAVVAAGFFAVKTMQAGKAPEISLKDANAVTTVYIGDSYKEPGYSAKDASGHDITSDVKVTVPKVENSGSYVVKYTVAASNGKSASAERKIKAIFHKQTTAGRERGLAVLMYHKVYDADNPPKSLDSNCISNKNLEQEFKYLTKEKYYFPTWEEVSEYLDGKIDLPKKSVVLTFDDGTDLFLKYGTPLIEKYDVRATAFIITSKNGRRVAARHYKHISLQSHSNNMHRPGGHIGHGGVFTALKYEDALADLQKSIKILGTHDAFAYPFGDNTKKCEKEVKDAGFLMAFTTAYGKVHPGDDPYLLDRVRVNGNISLDTFKSII